MTERPQPFPTAATAAPRAIAALILCMSFWGANIVCGRLIAGQMDPLLLTMLRWAVSGLLVALALPRAQLAQALPALKPRLAFLAAMGAIGFTGFNALFYLAATLTTGLNMAVISAAMPIFILAGVWVFDGQAPTGLQALGMGLAILGVALVATAGDPARLLALDLNLGDLAALTATLLYAGYAVFLRRRPQVPGLAFYAALVPFATLSAFGLVLLQALIAGEPPAAPTPQGWLIMLIIAIFPSFLSQLLFLKGVEVIGPGRASIYTNLVPIFGAAFSILILGERLQTHHLIALALVAIGIFIAEKGRPRPRALPNA